MIKLSIIILNYNSKDLTSECIHTLLSTYKIQIQNGTFELIIVDNASSDASLEAFKKIKSTNKNIQLIQNKENEGFTKGNNSGAEQAHGEYILFLNSDTEVLDKSLENMVEYLDDNPDVAVLGGKLSGLHGEYQRSAGSFYDILRVTLFIIGLERPKAKEKNLADPYPVDWVSGGCMMVRSEIFRKMKGFDENLFMYVEDMEFCYRLKKAGYNVYYFPKTHILHVGQGSSNRSFAIVHIYKGLLYFYKKHQSYMAYLFVKNLLIIKALFAIGIGTITNNKYLTHTYKAALTW